MDFRWT